MFGQGDDRKIFQQMLGLNGGPAFARRASEVQSAYDALLDACRRSSARNGSRLCGCGWGTLFALAGDCAVLAALVGGDERWTFSKPCIPNSRLACASR